MLGHYTTPPTHGILPCSVESVKEGRVLDTLCRHVPQDILDHGI